MYSGVFLVRLIAGEGKTCTVCSVFEGIILWLLVYVFCPSPGHKQCALKTGLLKTSAKKSASFISNPLLTPLSLFEPSLLELSAKPEGSSQMKLG